MKVQIDQLAVREFGRAAVHSKTRFYYRVLGYNCLCLVTEAREFQELIGQVAIALFEFDKVDGRIICQKFPGAPVAWRDIAPGEGLIQVSLKSDRVWRVLPGEHSRAVLSEAIKQQIGKEC